MECTGYINKLTTLQKDYSAAIDYGEICLMTIDDSQGCFDNFGWAWRSGELSENTYESDIDEAQSMMFILQNQLRKFNTKLEELGINEDISFAPLTLEPETILESLFRNTVIQDNMDTASCRMGTTRYLIEQTLLRLKDLQTKSSRLLEEQETKLNSLILE